MVEGYIQQLVNYLKKNLAKGYTIESLRWALINQGHSRVEISKAMQLVNEELAKKAPKFQEKPVIKVEREPILKDAEKKKSIWQNIKDWFS